LGDIRYRRVMPIAVFVLSTIHRYNRPADAVAPMSKKTAVAAKPRKRHLSRGRPPVHSETWSKVSVVLFDRQILHLDRLATDIRGKSGKVLNRAEIIRALIDGLIDSKLDITATGSEADLRSRIARRLASAFR
jgi:hypothetical protein